MKKRWLDLTGSKSICAAALCAVVLLCVSTLRAGGPTTAPAEAAQLLGGKITYVPPPGWDFQGARTDGRSAGYARVDKPAGLIVITATPQTNDIVPQLGNKLYQQLLGVIKSEVDKGNIQSVSPPKRISDARFLLKLHDQFKAGDKFGDRVMLYRAAGRNLICVVATAFSHDAADQAAVTEAGEALVLSAAQPRAATKPAKSN